MKLVSKQSLALLGAVVAMALIVAANFAGARDSNKGQNGPSVNTLAVDELPHEGQITLQLIKKNGPFPFRKDGSTFGNRERQLPRQQHGYYKEYTVKTPGANNRGARRIVAGSPGEYYYTGDHYNTFQRIVE
jgi:ribonuclease T1